MNKKTGLFVFLLSFIVFSSKVCAFDTNKIKISNSIYFPWLTDETIDIGVNDTYKDNNPYINYQFIRVTEEQSAEFTKGYDEANTIFKTCKSKAETDYDYQKIKEELTAQGKDYNIDEEYKKVYADYRNAYNSCVKTYDSAVAATNSKIPTFDESKWVKQDMTDSDNVKYSIKFPSDLENFVMWVNAKDSDNNDLYSFSFLKNDNYKKDEPVQQPEQEEPKVEENEEPKDEVIEKPKEETKKEEIKEEEIKNPSTGIYGVCGLSILCVVLLFVLKEKSFISKI